MTAKDYLLKAIRSTDISQNYTAHWPSSRQIGHEIEEKRKKGKRNFITVVMSAEKDLHAGSDPGSIAYLQTCSSNTSGQVISYPLICRDDLISPIRRWQSYDSHRLHNITVTISIYHYRLLTEPTQSSWSKLTVNMLQYPS